jgi:hypothetical protein
MLYDIRCDDDTQAHKPGGMGRGLSLESLPQV